MSTAPVDLAVRGGTLVGPRSRTRTDLWIDRGRVVHVGAASDLEATRTVDATGLLILPGMVDVHVHLMEPGDGSREDVPSGTAAAACAGVTTIVEHTHHWPVTGLERLRDKQALLPGRAHVDVGLAAHVWPDALAGLGDLWRAGIAFFKAFTCSTHGVPGLAADTLADALDVLAALDAPALVHCEDDLLTARAERRLRAAGRLDGRLLVEWRNRPAEEVAVATVCLLARAAGAAVAIAHVSSADVLDIVDALADGSRVVAESCPQYLLLHEDEVEDHGTLRKFTPPARIRSASDAEHLWQAFEDGRITYLASDHAPSTIAQKTGCDLWSAPFGLPGLDTSLPLMVDAALSGRTCLETVVARYADAPARTYRLAAKGRLVPGADADLVLVDPHARTSVDELTLHSGAGWSPYAGRPLRGEVVSTWLRGHQIAESGRPVGPPQGRFLAGAGRRAHSEEDQ